MLDLLVLFVAGFVTVFALGFQSRSVNGGNYVSAAIGSFSIAMFQVPLWQIVANAHETLVTALVYGLSGATAITASMFVHQRVFPRGEGRGVA